ncbi:MAG: hypothetical protein WKG32_19170 [Gemmatimonadaceae bacterium]
MTKATATTPEEFDRVIAEGVALQEHLPWLQMIAVGGTAAAMHARHRYSGDTDHVTLFLRENFTVVAEELERWPGWRTNRLNAPVLILGERHDVELGVRQSRRAVPYEIARVRGLWVPTAPEALRIKAYVAATRRATRDFVDVAALADLVGWDASLTALSYLNLLYEPVGNQTALTKFAECCHQEPLDLERTDLSHYKGLRPPYDDWTVVRRTCRALASELLVMEMESALPATLDAITGSPEFQPNVLGTPRPRPAPP